MKTISLKKVSAVAVASLGFGLLSVVPASAAQTTAATYTSSVTNSTNTGATTAPIPSGTAMTANLTLATSTDRANLGDTASMTFTITDANSADITSTCTFAKATANGTTITSISTPTSAGLFTVVLGGADSAGGDYKAAITTTTIGTVSCPSTMGGTYTITPTGSVTTAAAATITPTKTPVTYVVSGANVSQGTTRGLAGAAKIANQGKVTVTFPTHTNAGTRQFKITSSGVGAIIGSVGSQTTPPTVTTIAGTATDFSQGVTHTLGADTALSTNVVTVSSTVAGLQTITVTEIDTTTGLSTALYSATVTWSAIAALSPGASIVRIAPTTTAANAQGSTPATANAYTTALDAIPYIAPRAAGNKPATIQVILINNDGTAATQGHTVTATVSGSGFVDVDNSGAAANGTVRSDSYAMTAGTENVAWVHISGDGTAGTGTIGLTVTDVVSGVTTALPSKTVTFNGSVAKLAVTTTNFTIGKAGLTTGGAATARVSANEIGDSTNTTSTVTNGLTTTPAFIVTATDSGGRATTTGVNPAIVSSDANVVSGGSCALDDGSNADYSATRSNGNTTSVGVYNCNFSSAANAASGAKATLTIRVADPLSTTGGFLTTTLAVTIGGSIATETVAFDKTSYAPGEAMVITRTAKDSAGNPVADGSSAGAVTFNKAVGGTAPGAGVYVGGVSASSTTVAKATVFAPSISGALTASMTGGDAAATVRTASSTVADGNAAIMTQIDALNAKIVALNALIAKIMKKLGVK